ncbi:MAG TPA: phage antirepressor N-terminal domain-containing protein [Ktedonobacterales bacterium]
MAAEPEYCFYEDSLPDWGIARIMLAEDEQGDIFFPVRPICEAIGIDRSTQAAIVQQDSRTKKGARNIWIPTRGGKQKSLCLRKHEVGIWLAIIDPPRVGERARGRLEEFQEDLWALADRIVFRRRRGVEAGTEDTGTVLQLHGSQRGEILCECGRLHVFEIANGEVRVWHR